MLAHTVCGITNNLALVFRRGMEAVESGDVKEAKMAQIRFAFHNSFAQLKLDSMNAYYKKSNEQMDRTNQRFGFTEARA